MVNITSKKGKLEIFIFAIIAVISFASAHFYFEFMEPHIGFIPTFLFGFIAIAVFIYILIFIGEIIKKINSS